MELLKQHFSQGVKNIITGHSSGEISEECSSFSSSTHPQRELFYVLEGKSHYMLNGKVFQAEPGTFFLIDHWEPHAFGYRKQDHNLIHLWLHGSENDYIVSGAFLKVGVGGEFNAISQRVKLPIELHQFLDRRWNSLCEESVITGDVIKDFLQGPLEAILDEICFSLFHPRIKGELLEKSDSIIEPLKRYIRMSNARDCSLSRLEKISGYSRYYLSHRFREYEGCTIGEYIDKIRIQYTIEAMKRGLRQKEIAFELGFSSPSNFWTWFQKHRKQIEEGR
jgi:AraC-like DNA-binding protein